MVNFKAITQGVESLLRENLSSYDYLIERNPIRPDDPYKAAQSLAWVGIYRGTLEYNSHTTGNQPFLVEIEVVIEIQVASLESAEDAEDKLCDAEIAILNILKTDKKLNSTVDHINGYGIEYEMNEAEATFYQSSIITVRAEVRSG